MSKVGRPKIERHEVAKKECVTCEQIKPASEFFRDSKNANGLRYSCKVCYQERQKERIIRDFLIRREGRIDEKEYTDTIVSDRYRNLLIRPKVK